MITLDQIKPFCSTDLYRIKLAEPFNLEEWTYATDGRIIVRIKRGPETLQTTKYVGINPLSVYEGVFADWFKLPAFEVEPEPVPPEPKRIKCEECGGTGECDCNCPKCGGECEECGGDGEVTDFGPKPPPCPIGIIKGTMFNLWFIEKIQRLGEMEWSLGEKGMMAFRNEDCEGRIMAMEGKVIKERPYITLI
jgi:hypothetical protein